jgi:Ca2+-binding RTX toxin-like protein
MDAAAVTRDVNGNVTFIDDTPADILLGGGGSDVFEGKAGNDIIDGDRWLNIRISVRDAQDASIELLSVNSLNDIQSQLMSGAINPGQLQIVREVLDGAVAGDLDTAVYRGNLSEYAIERHADGRYTITHNNLLPATNDGIDTVRNVEFLRFADQTVSLINEAPIIISEGGTDASALTVAENSDFVTVVTATDANLLDVLSYSISGGADAALFTIDATNGVLSFNQAPNFEATTDVGGNNVYNVIVQVSDGQAVDTQALAVTISNVDEAPTGALYIGSFASTNNSASLTASHTIVDPDVAALALSYQWQRLAAGNWVNIAGPAGTAATLANQSSTTVRVSASYTDPFGVNNLVSVETAIVGSNLVNTLNGTAGNEILLGLGGNDNLIGGGGDDNVDGGAGTDTLRAGVDDGNDVYAGGAGSDTYDLALTAAAATVNLSTGSSASAQTGSDTLAGIENVNGSSGDDSITDGAGSNALDGNIGNDRFILTVDNARDTVDGGAGTSDTADYSAFLANLSVTLGPITLVTGSGNTNANSDLITNIENFIGGAGNDTLTGNAGANQLTGGAGNDTLSGGTGADQLTGGAGRDVFDYNATNESAVGAAVRDVIADFLSGTDRLDFATIDANTGAGGNQAFVWNATAGGAFTGAGQLIYRFETVGGVEYTVLEGNVNANLATDFQVALLGRHTLQAADLVL